MEQQNTITTLVMITEWFQKNNNCCRPKPKLLTITEMVNVTNISQHTVVSAHKINHIYFAMSVNGPSVYPHWELHQFDLVHCI